ncbi:hypothetical protein [Hyphomicrobium sp. DY-1]|uniref:hypothetical protein n=1 Tax=Hyphomicrobium sp. DY-1 TaxID=3075650 RepID=UPI0039C3167E
MTPNLPEQVKNVLAGRTAMGERGYGPIGYPRDPAAMKVLLHWSRRFLAECAWQDDRTRTLFIRKLATYLIRHGYHDDDQIDFTNGTLWFATNPIDLLSKMSFNAAARRREQHLAVLAADHRRIQRDLLRSAMAVPEPPCPVLLQDGHFRLVQFVHPMHLLRAGTSADNCLIQLIAGEELPNPEYWMRIARGEANLFAITSNNSLCAVFSISNGAIREFEYVNPPADILAFLHMVNAELERRYGPIRDELTHVMIDGEMVAAYDIDAPPDDCPDQQPPPCAPRLPPHQHNREK